MLINLRRFVSAWWPLSILLLCAAILRIGWPGIAEFKFDEATLARRAIGFAQEGLWPASTISSVTGIPQPSYKAILLAIPFAFTRDPEVAVGFQGILGVLTIWLVYLFAKRYFGERVALIACIFLTFAPWAIFYDRKLWAMSLPLLTLIMTYGIYGFLVDQKNWAIVVSFGALGLQIGFYVADVILIAVAFLSLIVYPHFEAPQHLNYHTRGRVRWVVGGIAVLLVTLVPYGLDFVSGRGDIAAGLGLSRNSQWLFDPIEQIRFATLVATGYQFHALAGDKANLFYPSLNMPDLNNILDLSLLLITASGMVYVIGRAVQSLFKRRGAPISQSFAIAQAKYRLIAIWIAVPIVVWTAAGLTPYPHRYVMLYPAQSLAAAVMLNDLLVLTENYWRRAIPWTAGAISIWLGILAGWQTIEYVGMLSFVNTHPIVGGHGRPVGELWATSQRARELSDNGRLPIVVYTSGDDPEYEEGASQMDAVLGDLHLYLVENSNLMVAPSGAYVQVIEFADGRSAIDTIKAAHSQAQFRIARLANGIDLISVKRVVKEAGNTTDTLNTFIVSFQVWASPPEGNDFGYTVQLYNDSRERLGQTDGAFLRSTYWGIGDMITIHAKIEVESNQLISPANILVALYAYVSETAIEGVDILDIAGNPAGREVVVVVP